MNIFGADMVSTDTIIKQIQDAKENSNICKLELEDFFVADRSVDDTEELALELKELLEHDDRPWELVHYVDDLIEGIYRLLMSDYHQPVNVGNPSEITIKDFAEEVVRLTETGSKLIYQDLP